MLSFGSMIAPKLMSAKVSLVWSSDSAQENSRRLGHPWRNELQTTGLLGIRREALAAWLERLLSAPALLMVKRRIARLLPKK